MIEVKVDVPYTNKRCKRCACYCNDPCYLMQLHGLTGYTSGTHDTTNKRKEDRDDGLMRGFDNYTKFHIAQVRLSELRFPGPSHHQNSSVEKSCKLYLIAKDDFLFLTINLVAFRFNTNVR